MKKIKLIDIAIIVTAVAALATIVLLWFTSFQFMEYIGSNPHRIIYACNCIPEDNQLQ